MPATEISSVLPVTNRSAPLRSFQTIWIGDDFSARECLRRSPSWLISWLGYHFFRNVSNCPKTVFHGKRLQKATDVSPQSAGADRSCELLVLSTLIFPELR